MGKAPVSHDFTSVEQKYIDKGGKDTDAGNGNYVCPLCNSNFQTLGDLIEHSENKHGSNNHKHS